MVVGVVLLCSLTWAGCNTDTKNVEEVVDHHSTEESSTSHEVERPMSNVAELAEDADLDAVVELAMENIAKGRETEDMELLMTEGILKLRAVNMRDSNNIKAIYQLGVLSVESGQFEKAEKRFEKLILLQPENQEYQEALSEIRSKLSK